MDNSAKLLGIKARIVNKNASRKDGPVKQVQKRFNPDFLGQTKLCC
jgi:hypothetical protein